MESGKGAKMVAMLAILSALLVIAMGGCSGDKEYIAVRVEWTVYQKTYVPATSGTSGRWGYSFANDGGMVYIPGEAGTQARYEFLLKREKDGEVETKTEDVEQEEFASYEIGDTYTTKEWEWVTKGG